MNLDDDPFEIACWEEYAKFCISQGKLKLFRSKLSEYIEITNRPMEQEIHNHFWRRKGEIDRDEMRKQKYSNVV